MPDGSFRSLLGYAGESLAIGRALVCGYNVFFKAWRDAKYDAVLDFNKVLFRVEIKQTSGSQQLSVTAGGRSGRQISRSAESREQVLSTEDCDFVIGVHSLKGTCWIIPVEFIEILGRKNLNMFLLKHFEEKWKIFQTNVSIITPEILRDGLRNLSSVKIDKILKDLGIKNLNGTSIETSSRTKKYLSPSDFKVAMIWITIAKKFG